MMITRNFVWIQIIRNIWLKKINFLNIKFEGKFYNRNHTKKYILSVKKKETGYIRYFIFMVNLTH